MYLACKYLETLFQRPKTHYKFQIRKVRCCSVESSARNPLEEPGGLALRVSVQLLHTTQSRF